MNLVKYNDSSYLNIDMIESLTFDGRYKVFVTGSLDPYIVSEEAFNIILTHGKQTSL